jgi:hypothetical protein
VEEKEHFFITIGKFVKMCNDDVTIIIEAEEDFTTVVIENDCEDVTIVSQGLGANGLSAYDIAVANGFVGTEEEWLDSLKAKTYIRRHDFVSDVSYCGYAEIGSLETDSVWNISKIVVAIEGTTTTTHAQNVKWSERLTINYN